MGYEWTKYKDEKPKNGDMCVVMCHNERLYLQRYIENMETKNGTESGFYAPYRGNRPLSSVYAWIPIPDCPFLGTKDVEISGLMNSIAVANRMISSLSDKNSSLESENRVLKRKIDSLNEEVKLWKYGKKKKEENHG